MIQLICFFFPTFFALYVINKKKKLINRYLLIETYAIYNILINCIVLGIVYFMKGFEYLALNEATFSVSFSLKYLVISSIVGYILPLIIEFLKKNMHIKLIKR